MDIRDTVRMANQIATFFSGYGEATAKKEIANHINSFWEPRMRRKLFEVLDQHNAELNPLVVAAAADIRRPSKHPDPSLHPEATGG